MGKGPSVSEGVAVQVPVVVPVPVGVGSSTSVGLQPTNGITMAMPSAEKPFFKNSLRSIRDCVGNTPLIRLISYKLVRTSGLNQCKSGQNIGKEPFFVGELAIKYPSHTENPRA